MDASTIPQRQSSNPSLENGEQQSEGNPSVDTISCNNKTTTSCNNKTTTSRISEIITNANERSTVISAEDSVSVQKQLQQQKLLRELEEEAKNEVLKTEAIEKKQREEEHFKIMKQKDKYVRQMQDVKEAYRKTIPEITSAKGDDVIKFWKQLDEVMADRDSIYYHEKLLEMSYSELYVKYEKCKEKTLQLKDKEDFLLAERKHTLDNIRLKEQRYDKMKNHAMEQLELLNIKLESLEKPRASELSNMLLKKEEVSLNITSLTEQLKQETREIAELGKMFDEIFNRED